jgi:hypothetical protein
MAYQNRGFGITTPVPTNNHCRRGLSYAKLNFNSKNSTMKSNAYGCAKICSLKRAAAFAKRSGKVFPAGSGQILPTQAQKKTAPKGGLRAVMIT